MKQARILSNLPSVDVPCDGAKRCSFEECIHPAPRSGMYSVTSPQGVESQRWVPTDFAVADLTAEERESLMQLLSQSHAEDLTYHVYEDCVVALWTWHGNTPSEDLKNRELDAPSTVADTSVSDDLSLPSPSRFDIPTRHFSEKKIETYPTQDITFHDARKSPSPKAASPSPDIEMPPSQFPSSFQPYIVQHPRFVYEHTFDALTTQSRGKSLGAQSSLPIATSDATHRKTIPNRGVDVSGSWLCKTILAVFARRKNLLASHPASASRRRSVRFRSTGAAARWHPFSTEPCRGYNLDPANAGLDARVAAVSCRDIPVDSLSFANFVTRDLLTRFGRNAISRATLTAMYDRARLLRSVSPLLDLFTELMEGVYDVHDDAFKFFQPSLEREVTMADCVLHVFHAAQRHALTHTYTVQSTENMRDDLLSFVIHPEKFLDALRMAFPTCRLSALGECVRQVRKRMESYMHGARVSSEVPFGRVVIPTNRGSEVPWVETCWFAKEICKLYPTHIAPKILSAGGSVSDDVPCAAIAERWNRSNTTILHEGTSWPPIRQESSLDPVDHVGYSHSLHLQNRTRSPRKASKDLEAFPSSFIPPDPTILHEFEVNSSKTVEYEFNVSSSFEKPITPNLGIDLSGLHTTHPSTTTATTFGLPASRSTAATVAWFDSNRKKPPDGTPGQNYSQHVGDGYHYIPNTARYPRLYAVSNHAGENAGRSHSTQPTSRMRAVCSPNHTPRTLTHSSSETNQSLMLHTNRTLDPRINPPILSRASPQRIPLKSPALTPPRLNPGSLSPSSPWWPQHSSSSMHAREQVPTHQQHVPNVSTCTSTITDPVREVCDHTQVPRRRRPPRAPKQRADELYTTRPPQTHWDTDTLSGPEEELLLCLTQALEQGSPRRVRSTHPVAHPLPPTTWEGGLSYADSTLTENVVSSSSSSPSSPARYDDDSGGFLVTPQPHGTTEPVPLQKRRDAIERDWESGGEVALEKSESEENPSTPRPDAVTLTPQQQFSKDDVEKAPQKADVQGESSRTRAWLGACRTSHPIPLFPPTRERHRWYPPARREAAKEKGCNAELQE